MARQLTFIVDLGVGKSVEIYLESSGFKVIAVRNLDPRMSDREILLMAVENSALVITMDKDFGELVYNSGVNHSGVLLLRLEDATGEEKQMVVTKILANFQDKMVGHFSVYQNGKLRIR